MYMSKENGNNTETIFKKNIDYFELKDGVYMTVESLCKKYECQHTHIYRRAKEFNVPSETILGTKIIKDSEHFIKKPKANNLPDGTKLTGYAELHRKIEDQIQQSSTIFAENTILYKEIRNDIKAITSILLNLVEASKMNNKLLNTLLHGESNAK